MSHTTIAIAETALKCCNRDQGLGFVAGGKLLDRATVKNIFVAMFGFVSTVVPLFLAMRPELHVAGGAACALSAHAHRLGVRSR